MSLNIAQADPLAVGDELTDLFRRHDRPDFGAFLHRAFPAGTRAGGRNYVARDDGGRLVAHAGWFAQRFTRRGAVVEAGLITNLMMAKEQRTFFPALSLLRRLVTDARAARLDFLYGDPSPSAQAVLRALGFAPIGTLTRYVMPASHATPLIDALVRMYHVLPRRPRGWRELNVQVLDAERMNGDAATAIYSDADTEAVRPVHDRELYTRRLEGWPRRHDRFLRVARPTAGVAAAALVRGPSAEGVVSVCAVYPSRDVHAALLIAAVVRQLREFAGCRTIQIWTLAESRFAATLRSLGFLNRGDPAPLLALGLTDQGAAALREIANWEITDLDCDR